MKPDHTPQHDEPSITYRGKNLELSKLPKPIQDLFGVRDRWSTELANNKVETFKLEAAIRGLDSEIDHRLSQMIGEEGSDPTGVGPT